MQHSLTILNFADARYECTYGRGCDGICCREGNPIVYPDEVERIDANMTTILPLLRPAAQAVVQRRGYLRKRHRLGYPTVRNVQHWCVFFNNGCVLHRLGESEGDRFRYKPSVCSLFPIQSDDKGNWYVRQHGYKNEKWDLFCLDPNNSQKSAADTLGKEIALAQHFEDDYQAAKARQSAPT
jgi:hypothetical protein